MEGSDAEELEELEADVKEMAQKVRHYRTTLPDQLKATFTSILSSQRPPFLEFVSGSEPEASGEPKPGQFRGFGSPPFSFSLFSFPWGGGEDYGGRTKRVLLAQGDHETSRKYDFLLKRLNECMSMVDKLDSYNGIMHPAFKRRRTSDLV
ncbi:hypothetical protein AAG906_027419 [Vitis piasezkii]